MNKRRKILAAMLAAFMLLVPMVSTAQIDIKVGDEETSDLSGTWGTMRITDNETEEYVPLGEGLWLLAGAAGLYLLVKSRKTRKATAVTAAALALTLGTTQCKKTEESVIPAGETISISFRAGNGAKADIDVYTGRITWNEGDKVYVVCNNANYAPSKGNNAVLLGGNLTAKTGSSQQSEISGKVTVPVGYTLPTNPSFTFYYVGSGVDFSSVSGSTNLTFNISDQNGNNDADLNDAGEYMVGRTEAVEMENDGDKYVPSEDGAKHFDPLTSVLRLDTKEFGAGQLTMSGGNSKMTIDLGTTRETITYTPGYITFTSGEDVQISVLPTTAGDATLDFWGNGKVGSITVTNGIKAGRIYSKVTNNAGYPIPVEAEAETDLLPGKFSVSADKYVQFSRGNLYCTDKGSKNYEFSFEQNQYDYRCRSGIANDKAVIGGTETPTPSSTSGLFQWIPRTSSFADKDWGAFSGYSSPLSGGQTSDVLDFGGVFLASDWTTLTGTEWQYLLEHHTNKIVTVNGVLGLCIAPDAYIGDIAVSYTVEQWSVAEGNGMVFLPYYGYYNPGVGNVVVTEAAYWSSTASTSVPGVPTPENCAQALKFHDNSSKSISIFVDGRWRHYAQYVRLVQRFPKPDDVLEFKDLGLTSGTLWANMNLGAKRICDYGDYYAWGATEPYYTSYTLSEPSSDYHTMNKTFNGWKKTGGYSQANAPYYSGGKYTKYNDTDNLKTLEASDDAATQKLGPEYSIPTVAQFQELIDECEWEHVVYEGVSAYKVSGKKEEYKDMFIILPVCGRVAGTDAGYSRYADYWSNCAYYINHTLAQYFEASNEKLDMKAGGGIGRYLGFPIRPVKNAAD